MKFNQIYNITNDIYSKVFNMKLDELKITVIQDNFFILVVRHNNCEDKLLIRTINKQPITELILISQLENKLNKLYVKTFYKNAYQR